MGSELLSIDRTSRVAPKSGVQTILFNSKNSKKSLFIEAPDAEISKMKHFSATQRVQRTYNLLCAWSVLADFVGDFH